MRTGGKGTTSASRSQSTQAVDPNANLIWMELDSGSSGVLARQGDPAGAAAPNFSHDGTQIVYTSTDANQDGRLGVGKADLYLVPYGDRAGGAATALRGAAEADAAEYYPSFSPDDKLVAFNRLPQSDASVTPTGEPYDGGMYFNPAAEVWVGTHGGRRGGSPEGERSTGLHAAGQAEHARLSRQDRLGQLLGQVVAPGRAGGRQALLLAHLLLVSL